MNNWGATLVLGGTQEFPAVPSPGSQNYLLSQLFEFGLDSFTIRFSVMSIVRIKYKTYLGK